MKLVLLCGPHGTIRALRPSCPPNAPEREAALALLEHQPLAGQLIVYDKGLAPVSGPCGSSERSSCARGAPTSRSRPSPPIGFICQGIEPIVESLKNQLRLEDTSRPHPTGLVTRIVARMWRSALPSTSSGSDRPRPRVHRIPALIDQASSCDAHRHATLIDRG